MLYSKNVNRYPESITLVGAGTTFPTSGGVTGAPLPDITNKLTRINLYATYALQKNADLRFDYIHERWKTDDWSWLFSDGTPFTYGTTTDGTQVVQAPKQNADFSACATSTGSGSFCNNRRVLEAAISSASAAERRCSAGCRSR